MRPFPALSLAARLTALVLGLLVLALLLIGVTLNVRVVRFAQTQAESTASGRLSLAAQSAEIGSDPQTARYQEFQALVQSAQDAATWGVLSVPGRTYFTDSLPRPLPPQGLLEQARQRGRARWGDVLLLADGRGDVLGLALNTADVEQLTAGVVRSYGLIALTVLVLAGAALLLLLRIGLNPLRVMAARAATLGADNLAERLPLARPTDELHVLARSLNRMLARLQDAFAKLTLEEARTRTFVADASHELRTPLTAIAGSLDVLERLVEDPAPRAAETRARLLANLRREAQRAGRLIDDLLMLSRLDAGERLRREPLSLPSFLSGTLDSVGELAPDLQFTLDVPLDLTVHADPARLEGAMLNLLRNAAQHTPPGGTVILRARTDGPHLRLSVLNPVQLDPAFRTRMFDRFARGPQAAPGGSGLGLAIVQAVAQAHGGQVFAVQHDRELEVGLTLPSG